MTLKDGLTSVWALFAGLFGVVTQSTFGWVDVVWSVLSGTADTWFPMLSVLLLQIPDLLSKPAGLSDGELALLVAATLYLVIYAVRFRREADDEMEDHAK